jgi:hypothetical protein
VVFLNIALARHQWIGKRNSWKRKEQWQKEEWKGNNKATLKNI